MNKNKQTLNNDKLVNINKISRTQKIEKKFTTENG